MIELFSGVENQRKVESRLDVESHARGSHHPYKEVSYIEKGKHIG